MTPTQGYSTAAVSANAAQTIQRFVALGWRSPVSIWREACLRLGSRYASCRACADICPTQALRAAPQSLALGADCTGCGRCQAVCPTGALSVEGFAATPGRDFPEHDAAVLLDCWQVSSQLPSRAGIRVPCLGGLSVGRLLGLCTAADPHPLVLVDRGWCADCASGGAQHPARQSVGHAASLMHEAGAPDSRLPRLELRPLGVDRMHRPHADPMLGRRRSRRSFFAALAGADASAPAGVARPRPQRSAERQRTLEALQVLVTRYHGRMPTALFHRVEVRASCRGHGVCAAACPTGALVRYRDSSAQSSGVAYDNSACIACGECAAVCPEQAIAIHCGAGDVAQGLRRLNRLRQRECPDCGTRFALRDGEDESRCANCRKSAQLAHSAFQTLFGATP